MESVNARTGGLLWNCLRDGVERVIMGFSQRTDTILNSAERRPVMPASGTSSGVVRTWVVGAVS